MITNRPLPIKQLFRSGHFPTSFNAWEWVTDQISVTAPEQERTFHGMQVTFDRVENTWQRVINTVGQSGVCTFLCVAINNRTGQAKEAGVRVHVDGHSVYSDERIEVAGNINVGLCLIGKLYFDTFTSYPQAISRGLCPFDQSFIVEVFTDNISQMEIGVASRMFWTY